MSGADVERYGEVQFGEPLSWRSHGFRRLARSVVGPLARPYFRIKVFNGDRIPKTGPIILAPSHRSNLDTPLVGAAFPRWMRFMAKDSMFKSVFWTNFLVALGGFPVKRGKLDRQALDSSMKVLERGEPLVVFPEGARQEGPRIKPVFEGAVWISSRTGVPIIPMGIGGSADAQPIGVKMPRSVPVHFVLGEMLYPPEPLEGKKRVSRSQLQAYAEELREALQVVFDEAQESVGKPNGEWTDEDDARRQPWEEK